MTPLPIPKRLGRYKIVREIGQGATSTVYLATDSFSGASVAIKCQRILSGEMENKRQQTFFFNEAALAGKLTHPHIVTVLDAGHQDDLRYIVMEYVDGTSLKKFCDPAHLLPVSEALEIAFKCCIALDYSSKRGVIHRDIKPDNILVANNDNVKITDFGCSILVADTATIVTGVGSPAYMSPEQVSDQPVTIQTDIYSLGVVLFQLLTGHLPFDADNHFALIYKIINEPAPSVAEFRNDLPAGVSELVAKALEKKPGKRFANWTMFAKAIATVINTLEFPESHFSDAEKFQDLKKLHFFSKFTETELWEVLRISHWRRAHEGTLLIQEGDPGNSFFILTKGSASVTKNGVVIGHLEAGDCVGEMSLLSEGRIHRSATVQALSEVTLLSVESHQMQHLSEGCQLAFSKAFIEVLILRVLVGNLKLAEMAKSPSHHP